MAYAWACMEQPDRYALRRRISVPVPVPVLITLLYGSN